MKTKVSGLCARKTSAPWLRRAAKVYLIANATRVLGKEKHRVCSQIPCTKEQCNQHNFLAIFRFWTCDFHGLFYSHSSCTVQLDLGATKGAGCPFSTWEISDNFRPPSSFGLLSKLGNSLVPSFEGDRPIGKSPLA